MASVRRDRTKSPRSVDNVLPYKIIVLTLLKLCRLHGDIITVLIGSGASTAKFYIHAGLATQHSEFL